MHADPVFAPWLAAARRRRLVLLFLAVVPTVIAAGYMADVLPHKGTTPLELALVVVYGLLFCWISVGFWTAMAGFLTLMRRVDRMNVAEVLKGQEELPLAMRTAILMPIYNEDVTRVMAGLRATYESLAATGHLAHFDFYILSDTRSPDVIVEEEAAWADFCRAVNGRGRIFYRNRKNNIKRKSGNVADFCRRWGKNYECMVVFDADSVMTGETLAAMARIMQLKPKIGILQTAPVASGRQTLIARAQQFANRVYGPMFAAGLHYWQLGDAQYWGHNAMIRVAPFMEHCALARLPGKPPLGGDIMSHDFVEAALMRRAGYGVWLAYGLPGSYEEMPPTLLDELTRDRRWCQGNMQHLRLVTTQGLFPAHRALFLNGAMAYMSALLWFLFLILSTTEAIYEALREPVYFPAERSLFPDWPVWNPGWAIILLASTAVILFLPKLASLFLITVKERRSRRFGGFFRLSLSIFLEVILSTLLAPVRMLFHAKFVFVTLLGQQVTWAGQERKDVGTSWRDALRFHGSGMALGIVWGLGVYVLNRAFFWWLTPILIALFLAVPVSVFTSRPGVGRFFARLGLFLIPEEVETPAILRRVEALVRESEESRAVHVTRGFARVVVDPVVNALHLTFARAERTVSPEIEAELAALADKALRHGPQALSLKEKRMLLHDPARLVALHRAVWELPEGPEAGRWGLTALRPRT